MNLADFCQRAWADHNDAPAEVAQRLATSLHLIEGADHFAPYARLVVHLYGEHLGDWPGGIALLDSMRRLPAFDGAAARGAVERGAATLRHASGDAEAVAGLGGEDRAAVLAASAAILTERGAIERAIESLDAAIEAARTGLPAGSPANRALAVAGNNLAGALEGRESLDAQQTAAMIRAAEAGLEYWTLAGTWLEQERAEYQLARCLLRAGQARAAAVHARTCVSICEANDAPAFERFFGVAVHALACRAAGDAQGFEALRRAALDHHARVPAEERQWCEREFGELG
jgi:hypothetical protein